MRAMPSGTNLSRAARRVGDLIPYQNDRKSCTAIADKVGGA
jgi:hypothetical protein